MRAQFLPWEARRPFPTRRTTFFAALALLAAVGVAMAERAREAMAAADQSLAFVLAILLPLMAAATLLHLSDGAPLGHLGAAAARHGASRRGGVMKALSGVAVGLTALSCLLSWVVLVLARGLRDAHLPADLIATTPVAVMAAVAYAGWMAAGACFGARGAGALAALLLDWLVGATALPIALVTPRFHTRYLLGLEPAFTYPAWHSFAWLAGLAICSAGVVALRVPK